MIEAGSSIGYLVAVAVVEEEAAAVDAACVGNGMTVLGICSLILVTFGERVVVGDIHLVDLKV